MATDFEDEGELPPVPRAGPPPAQTPPRHEGPPFHATEAGRQMRERILWRAWNCCEGSHAFPDCRALNGAPHPVTGSLVVLTTAHVDQDDHHNAPANLRAWCQRCHLHHDRHQHGVNRKRAVAQQAVDDGQQPLPWGREGGDD